MFILYSLISSNAMAAIALPTNLSAKDQEEALGILGLQTSSKILSTPYPLGGYAGFEFGVGMEFLDVSDIATLGSKLTTPQSTVNYPRFSFGKGFYNDFDFFFHFTPYTENTGIGDYGGIVRWSAFQSAYLPTNISILLHSNATNIIDKVFTSSFGVDITAGFTLKYISLYFGGGQVESRGRFFAFNGGTSEEYRKTSSIHTFMGGVVDFETFFVATQMDRYDDTIFSVKLGIKR
ncbi:MAG: hypothetical protein A4S09_00705 [Proteobacteria bacterium SG_bin7]|nr:MAG: hypothetical protein A4S09_00705 [Proteobacteria bacterium SG_bin7]